MDFTLWLFNRLDTFEAPKLLFSMAHLESILGGLKLEDPSGKKVKYPQTVDIDTLKGVLNTFDYNDLKILIYVSSWICSQTPSVSLDGA